MGWLISANSKMYDHVGAFDVGYIDWRQKVSYAVGETVYIYATKPYMKIMFKTIVRKVNMSFDEITDDKKYWLNLEEYESALAGKYARLELVERVDSDKLSLYQLKENGLKAAPQGPMKVKDYLEANFNDYYAAGIFSEEVAELIEEGHKRTITINKYERSSVARQKCIEAHGLSCAVCDMNFEEVYGEIGKGFIHVQHIAPLHEIKGAYQVDYKKDLVSVCPNCHVMLHRKVGGQLLSLGQLKQRINK